jgi:hypothetical protein
MAATVRASYYGASATEPAGVSAETGITMNREDSQTGATPIPIPTSTGTNYGWYKQLALQVTGTAATTISNRKVALASPPATGLTVDFKAGASYAQATGANKPADVGTNDTVPAGYTGVTTTPQVYDVAGVSAAGAGRNGGFCLVVLGVSFLYTGGAGNAVAVPNLLLSYDEA